MSSPAMGQQGMTSLADTGAWAAGAYREKATDAPGLCVMSSATQPNGLDTGLRADLRAQDPAKSLEIRFENNRWELPPNLDGKSYQVVVGTLKLSLQVDMNTNHMIGSYLDLRTLQSLLAATDNA